MTVSSIQEGQQPKTLADLASLLEISEENIRYLAYKLPENLRYRAISIPKKNGKFRPIFAPRTDLKVVQRKLAAFLTSMYYPNGRATAYIKGSGIKRNAAFHEKNRLILNIDLILFHAI